MSVIRHSIRDQVRESLLRRIGSGELPPGTRLRENTLAKELGVSPIPVREAIRELTVMGVLDSQNHCGAWVREVSLSETIEALQVRSGLDAQAARLAADTLRGKCQTLREIVGDLMVSAQQSDFVLFQELNQVFHRLIVESSGNGVLLRIWDSLGFEVRTRAVMGYLSSCDPVGIAAEHEAIVDALDSGDGELAAQLLSTHSLGLVRRLEEQRGEEAESPRREVAKST
jgi:DNA-binding GntR family transcriptional regulator